MTKSSWILLILLDLAPSTLYAGAGSPVLLLQQGRFQVEVEWRDFEDATGRGRLAFAESRNLRSEDSAVLQFFGPRNWEALVKVLDGRDINERFWVFLAAATN